MQALALWVFAQRVRQTTDERHDESVPMRR